MVEPTAERERESVCMCVRESWEDKYTEFVVHDNSSMYGCDRRRKIRVEVLFTTIHRTITLHEDFLSHTQRYVSNCVHLYC